MAQLTNEELTRLVKEAQAGDESAYTQLYTAYYDEMYRIAIKNTMLSGRTNEEDAMDILQDAMLSSYKNLNTLDDPLKYPSWLSRIIVNRASDYMCSSAKKKNVFFSSLSNDDGEGKELEYDPEDERIDYRPDLKLEQQTKEDIVRNVLDTLSEDQRTVTMLCFYDGLTIKEAAEKLDIPMSTVVGRLQTAKRNIKESVSNIEKKQGIKLHGIAPLPFFLMCLGKASEETTEVSAVGALTSTAAATATATEAVVASSVTAKSGILASLPIAAKVGIGAAVATAVTTTAVVVPKVINANTTTNVDMFKNLTIEYEGADGYGIIKEINYEDSEGYKTLDNKDYSDFLDTVTVTSNKTDKLSNNDSITLTVLYDETKAEELNITFTKTSKEYKVEGLKEYPTIDVWKSIQVKWEENTDKTDYELKVNVTDNKEELKKVTFTPKYDEKKHTVKVTMDYTDLKDIKKYGFIPKDEKFSHTYKDLEKPVVEQEEQKEEEKTTTITDNSSSTVQSNNSSQSNASSSTTASGPTREGAMAYASQVASGSIYLYSIFDGYDWSSANDAMVIDQEKYSAEGYQTAIGNVYYSEENGYTADGGFYFGDEWVAILLSVY